MAEPKKRDIKDVNKELGEPIEQKQSVDLSKIFDMPGYNSKIVETYTASRILECLNDA